MSFTVTVQPSGRLFNVERDQVILAAAINQSIGLPYGCKDGACGSCKSKLLEGRVIHGAHQDKALSEAEEAQGYILTCCATPQTHLILENKQVAAAGQYPVLKMPVRVTTITRPAPDVAILKLQIPANSPLQYHAGQYIEFILRDGSRRSYSMASAPHSLPQAGLELHIRHMPGGKFTDHVFSAMKEKEMLRIEGPFGGFFLREESHKPMILLASGTGFAPIKAILEHVKDQGIEREMHLYWGCRSRVDLYAHEWAQQATVEMPHLKYIPVLSDAKPEDAWQGRTGLVHRAVLADWPDLSGHQVYACGAPVMVESAQRDFVAQAGLPEEEFFADSFTSEADLNQKK
jgi:CDP-4-dehydro-6-deoxyglucose reductase